MAFRRGDRVRHLSSRRVMRVDRCFGQDVYCSWFEGEFKRTGMYAYELLELIEIISTEDPSGVHSIEEQDAG